MKTRIGKIAQLPKQIRHELNHRLENGKQSPELLNWLNALPETKELLAAKFDDQPITKSNLSDWRHGGYQDWLRLRAREARIQRISESGDSLKTFEGPSDLFENFARMVIAELADDLETLHDAKNQKDRWQRLRELSRELARLQNGYNRSRWAELAWTKWNDRFNDGTVSDEPESSELANDTTSTNTQNATRNTQHEPRNTPPVVPDRAQSHGGDPHDSNSPTPEPTRPGSGMDVIHFTRCDCDDPCPKCHAPDSECPLDEAIRDRQFKKQHGDNPCDRHGKPKFLINCFCDCFCDRCAEKTEANPTLPMATAPNAEPARSVDFPVPGYQSPISNEPNPINPNPQPPLSPISPLSDHSRRMALLKSNQ
jgi:hypothetical protein